jgi:hypothetical protein
MPRIFYQTGAIRYQRRSIAVGRGSLPRGPHDGGLASPQCRDTTGKHDGNIMNMKRMRGRNHRSGGGGGGGGSGGGGGGMRHHVAGGIPLNRNHVFDSNGPDIRVRGTAQQLFEKYLQLGRDATSGGDRVMAEGYLQYAEHYFRVLNLMNQAVAQQGQGGGQGGNQQGGNQAASGQVNGHQGGQQGGQQGGGQQRYRPGYQNGEETPQMAGQEPEEAEIRAPGTGDQPEAREIPIATTPPEE